MGDRGWIPGLGRSHGEGNGDLLQCSHLEIPLDRGACGAIDHGVTESDTTAWLNYNSMHSTNGNLGLPVCLAGEGSGNHSVFFPGESHEQRSLVGCCPWGHTESDTTEAN